MSGFKLRLASAEIALWAKKLTTNRSVTVLLLGSIVASVSFVPAPTFGEDLSFKH